MWCYPLTPQRFHRTSTQSALNPNGHTDACSRQAMHAFKLPTAASSAGRGPVAKPSAEDDLSLAASGQESIEILPQGATCWLPASCTQLSFRPPPHVSDNDGRIAYLPATVLSPEQSTFLLDWDQRVVVKCIWSQVEARGGAPPAHTIGGSGSSSTGSNPNTPKGIPRPPPPPPSRRVSTTSPAPAPPPPSSLPPLPPAPDAIMRLDACNVPSCLDFLTARLIGQGAGQGSISNSNPNPNHNPIFLTKVVSTSSCWVNPINWPSPTQPPSPNPSPSRMQKVMDGKFGGGRGQGQDSSAVCVPAMSDMLPFFESIRQALRSSTTPQCLVLRGCSGSGKTEAAKHCLQYLLFASGGGAGTISRRSTIVSGSSSGTGTESGIGVGAGAGLASGYARLGTRLNALTPNNASITLQLLSRQLAASMALGEAFLHAASGVNAR